MSREAARRKRQQQQHKQQQQHHQQQPRLFIKQRLAALALIVLLAAASAASAAAPSPSHDVASGDHPQPSSAASTGGGRDTDARRLFDLLGADEPLLEGDVRELIAQLKVACRAPQQPAAHEHDHHGDEQQHDQQQRRRRRLSVADILQRFGRAGVLDEAAAEKACTAIMACHLDSGCALGDAPAAGAAAAAAAASPSWLSALTAGAGPDLPVPPALRAAVAVGLGLEALLGIYIPILLRAVPGYEWWLALLNCFSGGVFVAAGLVHLLPHCQEAQQRLPALAGSDYPLYLVLIVGGYMLVLFVERVLFSVHDAAHAHTHTGIVSRVNSRELVLPPGALEAAAAAAAVGGGGGGSGSGSGSDDDGGEDGSGSGGRGHRHHHHQQQQADPAAAAATPRGGVRTRRQAAALAASSDARKPLLADGADAGGSGSGGHGHAHGHGGHGHGGHSGSGAGGHVVCRHGHAHRDGGGGDLRQGVVLLVAMSVHTFLECMALGLMDGRREFLVLLGAIASHKLISGLALSSRFLKEGASARQVLLCVGPFALVAPVAIAAGAAARDVDPALTLVLSCFATGTFLYVGMSEIVEEEFEGDMRSGRADISQAFARWAKFGCLLAGVAMIALLAALPDAHGHGHGVGSDSHGHGHGGGHHHHHHHHHHH